MVALKTLFALLPLLASMALESNASPVKREVPQEKSHQKFVTATQKALQLNNPAGIVDPVFGLLGNAAAQAGAGSVTNLDCLQQITADTAFSNAKAVNDIDGMTAALVYRAIERNTGKVGLKSVICNETAVSPEIAALSQHQDPASENAAAENKAITLELARQINKVGGDPLIALESGTFAPGDINDPTGAGLSCDFDDCILENNRLVKDASEAEIQAAVAGGAVDNGAQANATVVAEPPAANATAGMAHVAPPPPPDVNAPPPPPPAHAMAAPPPPPPANLMVAPPPPPAQDLVVADQAIANATATAELAPEATALVNDPAAGEAGKGGLAGLKAGKGQGQALQKLKELIANAKAKKLAKQQAEAAGAVAVAEVDNNATAPAQADVAQVEVVQEETVGAGAGAANLDVGSCTDFSMTFSGGNDGRPANELTFIPTDRVSFPQASALNPNIIASAMCNGFVNGCAKSAATRDACNFVAANLASREASGEIQRDQGFADIWLSDLEAALGISSTGQRSGGGAPMNVDAVDNNVVDAAIDANNANAANDNDINNGTGVVGVGAGAGAAGQALQAFGGALNGKAAPAVVQAGEGDRPFSVNGDTFQNAQAAINRSCAVQHNACATAFNSGEGDSNVQACDAQEKECLAAGQSQAVRRSRIFR